MNQRRLIEEAFPLKKVSEDSKHEKNVRHGHISTLHIWPARRPLAACRAAIIAALMPDPGDDKAREDLCRRIGNITRWKSEDGPDLQFFRDEIRKAYGGRAPKVLDMFAGGGAIPLEAMRLGCDVTAIDYNPVAWFILKCTLEFPQKLAGKTWPLPVDGTQMNTDDTDKEENLCSSVQSVSHPKAVQAAMDFGAQQGDLAAHVRYWGNWVLVRARQELAPYYPMIDGKPTVAYLWARTVPCQDPKCGATVPLLKTLWVSKKEGKLRALRPRPNVETRYVDFEIWEPGPEDEVTNGTVSRTSLTCPLCGTVMKLDGYVQAQGVAGKMGLQMTAVVIEGPEGKEYRTPTELDLKCTDVDRVSDVPFGLPDEPIPYLRSVFNVYIYGLRRWSDLFTPRQLLALTTFAKWTRTASGEMHNVGYSEEQRQAIVAYLACVFGKFAPYSSTLCLWELQAGEVKNTFGRFALPMAWDFGECNPIGPADRYYAGGLNSVVQVIKHLLIASQAATQPQVVQGDSSSDVTDIGKVDAIITDPPYYDAIPYADISDFFYVWLRRILVGIHPIESTFQSSLAPKEDELVAHLMARNQGDLGDVGARLFTKQRYEEGMAQCFQNAVATLQTEGHMVIVFAHKDPDAWETLVTSMIKSGFVATASWPVDTEMRGGVRNNNRASLASSIWMVCGKRPADAGIGRYVEVKRKMQERVNERLRYFWDQGISGPDFVWAAVGPALESYSSYNEVRRMDGTPFTVSEFLREVRRLVTDFALGRILHGASTEGLDEWTRYYLMHRSSFELAAAPVGECILLAQGYGLDLNELKGPRGFIAKGKAKKVVDDESDEELAANGESETESAIRSTSGSDIRLLSFDERKRDDLGEPHPSGGLPLIDMLHRLMRLWQAGDTEKLTDYVQQHGLSQNDLFWAVAQAILEMAGPTTKERTLLEALVAWGRGKPAGPPATQLSIF